MEVSLTQIRGTSTHKYGPLWSFTGRMWLRTCNHISANVLTMIKFSINEVSGTVMRFNGTEKISFALTLVRKHSPIARSRNADKSCPAWACFCSTRSVRERAKGVIFDTVLSREHRSANLSVLRRASQLTGHEKTFRSSFDWHCYIHSAWDKGTRWRE